MNTPFRTCFYFLGALVLCAALLAGCATTTPVTVHQYNQDGMPTIQKRYAKYVAADWVHRWRTKAYREADDADFHRRRLSQDMLAILNENGRPGLIRYPFKSRGNELVSEWVYPDMQYMAQFVQGLIVYEGPLTDYERTLIQYGYPNGVTEVSRGGGDQFVHWTYRDWGQTASKVFAFNNDTYCYDTQYR